MISKRLSSMDPWPNCFFVVVFVGNSSCPLYIINKECRNHASFNWILSGYILDSNTHTQISKAPTELTFEFQKAKKNGKTKNEIPFWNRRILFQNSKVIYSH